MGSRRTYSAHYPLYVLQYRSSSRWMLNNVNNVGWHNELDANECPTMQDNFSWLTIDDNRVRNSCLHLNCSNHLQPIPVLIHSLLFFFSSSIINVLNIKNILFFIFGFRFMITSFICQKHKYHFFY